MTSIVGAALGVRPLPQASLTPHTTGQFLLAPERNVILDKNFLKYLLFLDGWYRFPTIFKCFYGSLSKYS